MARSECIITKILTGCLTAALHSPDIHATLPLSWRIRLISPRFRLVSSRRAMDAWVGRVLWRGLGGRLANWIRRTRRSRAAWRLRSWLRYWRASMIKTPSALRRLPARRESLCFTSSDKEGELCTLNLTCTAVETLLTFCPPGPGERTKLIFISSSGILISGVILTMR